jgi:hypothetical protein
MYGYAMVALVRSNSEKHEYLHALLTVTLKQRAIARILKLLLPVFIIYLLSITALFLTDSKEETMKEGIYSASLSLSAIYGGFGAYYIIKDIFYFNLSHTARVFFLYLFPIMVTLALLIIPVVLFEAFTISEPDRHLILIAVMTAGTLLLFATFFSYRKRKQFLE